MYVDLDVFKFDTDHITEEIENHFALVNEKHIKKDYRLFHSITDSDKYVPQSTRKR